MKDHIEFCFELLRLCGADNRQGIHELALNEIREAVEKRPQEGEDPRLSEIRSTAELCREFCVVNPTAVRFARKMGLREFNGYMWTPRDAERLKAFLQLKGIGIYSKKGIEKRTEKSIENEPKKDTKKSIEKSTSNWKELPKAEFVAWDGKGQRHDFYSEGEACSVMGIRATQLDYMVRNGRTVNGWTCSEA